MLIVLVVPCPLALRDWRSSCGVGRLVLVVGSGVTVRRRWLALRRVLLPWCGRGSSAWGGAVCRGHDFGLDSAPCLWLVCGLRCWQVR